MRRKKGENPKDRRGYRFQDLEYEYAFPRCSFCGQGFSMKELIPYNGLLQCKFCLEENEELDKRRKRNKET